MKLFGRKFYGKNYYEDFNATLWIQKTKQLFNKIFSI